MHFKVEEGDIIMCKESIWHESQPRARTAAPPAKDYHVAIPVYI